MPLNPIRLLPLCLAVALSVPALAQGSDTSAPAQDSGASVFKANCILCHGEDGSGNTPVGKAFKAAALTDPTVTKLSNDDLHAVIKNGKNGKMPAFKDKLSDAQIDSVIAYIRKLPAH